MTLPSAQSILTVLAVLFAILAVTRWAKEGKVFTPAVKTWARVAVIFAVVSLLLSIL